VRYARTRVYAGIT